MLVSVASSELTFPKQNRKAYRWNRDSYSRQRRFLDIWAFVLQLLSSRWWLSKSWSYLGGMTG